MKAWPFKRLLSFSSLSAVLVLLGCATPHSTTSTGFTGYLAYDGKQQSWPRASSTLVKMDFAIPAYLGLPSKAYHIIGFVVNTEPAKLPEWMWNDETRMANACNQAKQYGADAILVTNDPKIAQTFNTLATNSGQSGQLLVNNTGQIVAIKWTGR